MKIELLETVLHGRDRFEAGDIRTVPDEVGAYFCGNGWAKDVDGTVATGERSTTEVRLTPDNVAHANATQEAG